MFLFPTFATFLEQLTWYLHKRHGWLPQNVTDVMEVQIVRGALVTLVRFT